MRVTSNMMFSAGMTAMQAQQQELMQSQLQSASGLRIQKPSDDPTGAFRDLLFASDLSSVQSLKRTTDLASQRLQTADKSIGIVHDSMMQAYELAMQFAPGTSANDPQVLKGAAISALAIYQNIMTVANMEMDGVPLFGGGRTITPFDGDHLAATSVRVQTRGTGPIQTAPVGLAATVDDTFQVPVGQSGIGTTYAVTPSTGTPGGYDVTVNGQVLPPILPSARADGSRYLSLGNGVTFNLGGTTSEGDVLSFSVVPDGTRFKTTQTQLQAEGATTPSTVNVTTRFSAQVDPQRKLADLPMSIRVAYAATAGTYSVDINGTPMAPLMANAAAPGQPAMLDLGNGITVNLVGLPQDGDVLYFEVVPAYQGGKMDRPIQVGGGNTLPGNVTGAELVEGSGTVGRSINILGALAALRGALLRGDSNEVGVQLNRLDTGRGQTSDFQSLTGVRSTQVDATASIVATDEVSLQTLKATNAEADMFEVVSRLQKATQTMQMLTSTERTVLNLSLLDFIR
ncbi:MAG: hypothetical protein H7838_00070 [Magnetococcus sp. DMHC-8]